MLAALAVLLLVLAVRAAAGPNGPFVRSVYLVNTSTVVSNAELADALPAFQAATSIDFKRYWNTDAQLVVGVQPPRSAWVITISDDAVDCTGCLGYHDVTRSDTPFAKVFAKTSIEDGFSWQLVLTHELFEMLADPHVDRAAYDQGTFRLTEVGDPVEAAAYAYTRPGASGAPVAISDFVTERWYKGGARRGPFDFTGHVRRAQQLLPGGYVTVWDGSRWTQQFLAGAPRRQRGTRHVFPSRIHARSRASSGGAYAAGRR